MRGKGQKDGDIKERTERETQEGQGAEGERGKWIKRSTDGEEKTCEW